LLKCNKNDYTVVTPAITMGSTVVGKKGVVNMIAEDVTL